MRLRIDAGRGAALALALTASLLLAQAASALVIATIEPHATTLYVGDSVVVDLYGEFSAPDAVLGFGVDLGFDAGVVAKSGARTLGPGWLAFPTPDGDDLGGAALSGVTGRHLLASVTFLALSPGTTTLTLSSTPRDLTEGFALDPSGFAANVSFGSALLTVLALPEPRAATLLLTAGALFAARRRARLR